MGKLSDWIKVNDPKRVFVDMGIERFIQQDWDTPPNAVTLINMGYATNMEQANMLITKDKSFWGGSRTHTTLAEVDNIFGVHWPSAIPLEAKPVAHQKLVAADVQTIPDPDGPPGATKQVGRGFQAVFDDWKTRGLIL